MADVKVKLFKATWCGHCNAFKPEWDRLQKQCQELGYKAEAIDADESKDEIEKEGIRGFPTIKIYINGDGKEYEGQRSAESILSTIAKLKGEGSRPNIRLSGGGYNSGDGNYYEKYRKYKAKYLRMCNKTQMRY